MQKNFVEELRWRGMIHDVMPGTEDQLKKEMTAGYIGFDPTADSLHVGHLMQIMTLVNFQRCGHKPYALVGGATGMVGDPSGKSAERNLLSEDVLRHNQACVHAQLQRFLDFSTGLNSAEMVNNFDWFKDFKFLDFIRDVGKHITVNYMMAKDSVKNRLDRSDVGLSFTEFTYQLVQGYDFYWLFKNKNCKLQMGGSDQWGNIVTGTELIRRKDNGNAFALTTPLIKKSDGTKFGKTESGNVWLDPKKTSPYKFYQFWLNATDDDALAWIKVFTLMNKQEVDSIAAEHAAAPHERKLQMALAKDITIRVHSEQEYNSAVKASNMLFGNSTTDDLKSLDEDTFLSVFEGVPQSKLSKSDFNAIATVTDLLTQCNVFPSKGEARKMIQGGGVSVNKKKVEDANQKPEFELLQGKFLLAQKGKKNYYLIVVE